MTNTFASIYARHQEIKAQYEAAKAVGSEEGMAQARTDHRALMDSVEGTGKAFARIYRMYEDAMDVGNDYIDLADIHEYQNEAETIACLREYGIETFTFSSGWSSAVDSAWAFTQNGCTLQGMVEINSRIRNFDGDGYEKAHAFLFKVQ